MFRGSLDDSSLEEGRLIADALVAAGIRRLSLDIRPLGAVTHEGRLGLEVWLTDLKTSGLKVDVCWHPNFSARRALEGLPVSFSDFTRPGGGYARPTVWTRSDCELCTSSLLPLGP